MLKSDRWIKEKALTERMIEPFEEHQVKRGISFGLSSYGYDLRLADDFKMVRPEGLSEIDPKNIGEEVFLSQKAPVFTLPPNSYCLGRSLEYFRIPRNILTICFGKSTYARSGVLVNVTPFEPEWEGYVTLSIANTSGLPVRLYAGEGIAQILFLESDEICQVSYKDKKGKYQAQREITLPR